MNLFDIEDCDDSGSTLHVVEGQTDRRALLSGAAFLAVTIAAPAGAGSVHGDTELIRLGALLDTAWAEQAAREAAGADIEDAHDRVGAIVDKIERCSATTMAGLLVKTRACSWCHGGEPFDPDYFSLTDDRPTTDIRLAASVLRDLLTIGGKPVPQVA